MLLVADSGSTKADWILTLSDKRTIPFRTKGFNPFFVSEKDIIKAFQTTLEIQAYTDQVSEIYFFGAGCSSPDKREIISNALSKIFKNAFVSVDIDVIASIYATVGTSPGICCILGTGSNVTYFDGKKIQESKHGLGYALGDEGSGTYFGKKLVTGFLYETMPADLRIIFDKKFNIDKETINRKIYQEPFPNFYLASFSPFMTEHRDHSYIQTLLRDGFNEFINSILESYPDASRHTCHFVGSIAYHFSDILRECCKSKGISTGKILKHPIEELSAFIYEHGDKLVREL